MPVPDLSFLLGLVVFAYLSTFLVFAVLRILTGVSIQRVGLSGLRHIKFVPKDGVKVEIRGLGFQVHRPTFAQPTWISLVVEELKVIVDLAVLQSSISGRGGSIDVPELRINGELHSDENDDHGNPTLGKKKGDRWTSLINIKDRLKKLHHAVPWLRHVDLVAQRSSVVMQGVGTMQIGSFLISVDTRQHAIDRSRYFQHTRVKGDAQRPAEWTITLRSILFTPLEKTSIELLDHCVINIHGFLQQNLEGLRDASILVKLGRLHLPLDDIESGFDLTRKRLSVSTTATPASPSLDDPTPDDGQAFRKAFSEARSFVASVLRGIREVSFAVSFVGVSRRMESIRPSGNPLFLSMSLKELGLDLYRLDATTPAHAMYFSRNEIAHQVLFSAISVSVGVDDGLKHPDRLLYIPMTTATIKTTLPSKLLQFAANETTLDRNTNVLFSNLVVTSPSIDLNPYHLPLILALIELQRKTPPRKRAKQTYLISRFLPRANIRLSIQEPIIRVSLPSVEPQVPNEFNFDLLISTVSSISLEINSSHSPELMDTQYQLQSHLRINSHKLYYQTKSKIHYDLIHLDSIDLRAHVNDPPVKVAISATIATLSIFMVRAEINHGIKQIVEHLRSDVQSDVLYKPKKAPDTNLLRTLPSWLQHIYIQGTDFNVEVAGFDQRLSDQPRGFALHLESWTAEYRAIREEVKPSTPTRRGRRPSMHLDPHDVLARQLSPARSSAANNKSTNGRRIAFHFKGLDAFIIEGRDAWEQEACLSVPKAEMAFSTSNDGTSPILHLNSLVKTVYLQYSLFRHYCVSVAIVMLRNTFSRPHSSRKHMGKQEVRSDPTSPTREQRSSSDLQQEILVIDLRVNYAQMKVTFPDDPPVMAQVHDFELARHRFTNPNCKASAVRVHAESPVLKGCWDRFFSVKGPRIDLREIKKVQQGESSSKTQRSIDVACEAIRVGIPHQLVVYKVIDNFVNTFKTVAQLHHRFKTDSDEYILAQNPEGPRNVPRVTIRTQVLLFELEDGAFEWKLGVIYRTGLLEQKQRLAREAAFDLKVKRMKATQPANGGRTPATRSHSRGRGRSASRESNDTDHTVGDKQARSRSGSPRHGKVDPRGMRYKPSTKCSLTQNSQSSVDEARRKLKKYNSTSWKKRIDRAFKDHNHNVSDIRSLIWGMDQVPIDESYTEEKILQVPQRPALFAVLMSDLSITIDKPSFPLDQLPDFLHRVGKGLPRDTEFGLLIPLSAQFDIGECRATLRDYPLPLLHIPAIKPGQSPRLPSWSVKTDFVVAEEFRDSKSTKDLHIPVIPAEKLDPEKKAGGFAINVRRTVSPVKTYSDIKVEINTANDTRLTWGASYQAAIQDMMQVIEGFTKPQIDASERVGFWDKIRLVFHSRVKASWTGGGDVHLMLKGSRDPYLVSGQGAGFVMVWRNNVQWNIWQEDDPQKFMTVDSEDYVLAIPDFSRYARRSQNMITEQAERKSSISSDKEGLIFKKLVMKLTGKVRWQLGLVFERSINEDERTFEFTPHYEVTLRNPKYLDADTSKDYDAFKGFRSNFIHMSIAINAPHDRDWTFENPKSAPGYNAVHLTPRFFTHFFSWWSMFSGVMSLPVHQGALFPQVEKSGKKFSRHLATIKYCLLFSPLFLSHVYKHKEAEEFSSSEDTVSATGLKVRLDDFVLDLHSRREVFRSEVESQTKMVKTSGMRINQTLLDLKAADIRAVSAAITGTSTEAVRQADNARLAEYQGTRTVDLSSFNIPDNDFSWIDVDDFVEIDWTLPSDSDPVTHILPLAFAPRFTYRRQTDHNNTIAGDPNRHSPFGYEPTHRCIMTLQSDSRVVQKDLIQTRIDKLDEALQERNRRLGEAELQKIRATESQPQHEQLYDHLKEHCDALERKKIYLTQLLNDLNYHIAMSTSQNPTSDSDELDRKIGTADKEDHLEPENNDADHMQRKDSAAAILADHLSDFNNRFVVHNIQLKWNNSLRNIMLRYLHQVNHRRGFIYYTSRRAVKFILDIIEEQRSNFGSFREEDSDNPSRASFQSQTMSPDTEHHINERIEQLLKDGREFVNAEKPNSGEEKRKNTAIEEADGDVAQEFATQNSYHVRLVAPQIQLQSEKNHKAAVLVTSRGMRLKVYAIMDKNRISDDISGLVQRRYLLEMDNIQFFVTNRQTFPTDLIHIYSGNHYGTSLTTHWPPWVPVEVMFDVEIHSFGFTRIVQRTSATLRYDQYNKLRLKYNESVSQTAAAQPQDNSESRMDQVWVDFPRLRAICDSSQYYTMFIIVTDLLLWSEPLEKTRNERLEKIMLASDFSDLRGAPEMVIMLQDRIRQLEEIKTHFHVHEKYLDRQGWEDRIRMEQDLSAAEDELFFIMKAITTSQRRPEDKLAESQGSGLLRWYLSASEIVWHLTKEAGQPLMEVQLGEASYERTDYTDGSNRNIIDIHRIYGLNLLQNAMFPQIIAPYLDPRKEPMSSNNASMLSVNWLMLEAIAGIPVVDHFEISLFPLRIQLEYEIGKQIFEYVFPNKGNGDSGSSILARRHLPQPDEEEEEEDMARDRRGNAVKRSLEDAESAGTATGAGALNSRLTPTHRLPENKGSPKNPNRAQHKPKFFQQGLGIHLGDHRKHHNQETVSHASSVSDLRPSKERLALSPTPNGRETQTKQPRPSQEEKRTRFAVSRTRRSASADSRTSRRSGRARLDDRKTDDLTLMLNRASSYMTLAHVKIPSVVLCLSYKGKGTRNVEDVNDLVFRLPTLEWRNKTWSNLDLVQAVKKEVLRGLIHHAGAIIGNKLMNNKPGKYQQSRLREMAGHSAVMSSNPELVHPISSARSSVTGLSSMIGDRDGDSSVFTESPRVSDVADEEDGRRASKPPSSYSSSLVPTREVSEDEDDSAVMMNSGNSPYGRRPASMHSMSTTIDRTGTMESSSRHQLRSTLSHHLSGFTSKALKRETTAVPIAADDSHGTHSGSDNEANGTAESSKREKLKKMFHARPRV